MRLQKLNIKRRFCQNLEWWEPPEELGWWEPRREAESGQPRQKFERREPPKNADSESWEPPKNFESWEPPQNFENRKFPQNFETSTEYHPKVSASSLKNARVRQNVDLGVTRARLNFMGRVICRIKDLWRVGG